MSTTATMAKHTPGDWIAKPISGPNDYFLPGDQSVIYSESTGKIIAVCYCADDAEPICRAVNSHAELLEALEKIVNSITLAGPPELARDQYCLDVARAALARARG